MARMELSFPMILSKSIFRVEKLNPYHLLNLVEQIFHVCFTPIS